MTGTLIAEGKTKALFTVEGDPNLVDIRSKDDITAGDGAKRDSFAKKGYHATQTTCNVFDLLQSCAIPLAYRTRGNGVVFRALRCKMLPYEVVVRRVALGSYLKRNPCAVRGERFTTLIVEFFLKTNDKNFKGIKFSKDDPYIGAYSQQGIVTYRPDQPVEDAGNLAMQVDAKKIYGKDADVCHPFKMMEEMARRVFLVLEKAWDMQSCTLCDLKIEFGYTGDGLLVVADVIDNDSWRLFDEEDQHLDKQRYRDGAEVSEVQKLYENVWHRTERFAALCKKPTIILWRGSESDDAAPFHKTVVDLGSPALLMVTTGSAHKAAELCIRRFRTVLADGDLRRNAVVIAFVGLSNAAGPMLQGDTHLPVIGVPANYEKFPDDVWSSLRLPTDTPMVTCIRPSNAIHAALQMLAFQNPHAYMARRFVLESHKMEHSNSPSYGKSF